MPELERLVKENEALKLENQRLKFEKEFLIAEIAASEVDVDRDEIMESLFDAMEEAILNRFSNKEGK